MYFLIDLFPIFFGIGAASFHYPHSSVSCFFYLLLLIPYFYINHPLSSSLLLLLATSTWLWGRCGRHNSPPASSVMVFIFRRSDGCHVSVDTVHTSLLRSSSHSSPGWYHLQSLSSDVVLVSPLYVAKPPRLAFLHLSHIYIYALSFSLHVLLFLVALLLEHAYHVRAFGMFRTLMW